MQKHFRAELGNIERLAHGRRIYAEALNPYFGYFYTVKKSLVKSKTAYQSLQLLDTDEFGKVLLLDDITQVAGRNDSHYHEPMVHPAFCSHPKPESVLVMGGGDGGILREALKYPCVKRVELAELDDGVIEFSRKHLPGIHGGAFRDRRVRINVIDGRRYVEEHPRQFDVIIMDMTDPAGPSTMLYTKEFFGTVGRAFRNNYGIFVMHSESPVTRPKAFSCIQKTLRASFTHVTPFYIYIQMYATLWSVTLCSQSACVTRATAAAIDKKLARRGIRDLSVYSGSTHVSMQTSFPYITRLCRKPAKIITDADPEFPDDFLS
ncbi:MAG: polyamine aminopropyltransferase [Chitinispirillaceae bacterium]|jgi:spermidine synthase